MATLALFKYMETNINISTKAANQLVTKAHVITECLEILNIRWPTGIFKSEELETCTCIFKPSKKQP